MPSKSSLNKVQKRRDKPKALSPPLFPNQTSKRNTRQSTQRQNIENVSVSSMESSVTSQQQKQQNCPKIKIELAEETCHNNKAHSSTSITNNKNDNSTNSNSKKTLDTRNQFEFTNVNDLVVIEIVLDTFLKDMSDWQQAIDEFKENNSEFKSDPKFREVYRKTKHIFLNYIKSENSKEKDALKEELVRNICEIFFEIKELFA